MKGSQGDSSLIVAGLIALDCARLISEPQVFREQVVGQPQGSVWVDGIGREIISIRPVPGTAVPTPCVINGPETRVVNPDEVHRGIVVRRHVNEVGNAVVVMP